MSIHHSDLSIFISTMVKLVHSVSRALNYYVASGGNHKLVQDMNNYPFCLITGRAWPWNEYLPALELTRELITQSNCSKVWSQYQESRYTGMTSGTSRAILTLFLLVLLTWSFLFVSLYPYIFLFLSRLLLLQCPICMPQISFRSNNIPNQWFKSLDL